MTVMNQPKLSTRNTSAALVGKQSSDYVWESFRILFRQKFSRMHPILRTLKYAEHRLKMRYVSCMNFEELSAAGYDVLTIDDGITSFQPPQGDIPEYWTRIKRTITPKVATLRNAKLFTDGSVLLPDGIYCYFDTCYPHAMEENYFSFIEDRHHAHESNENAPKSSALESRLAPRICWPMQYYFNSPLRRLKILDHRTGNALVKPFSRQVTVSGRCFSTLSQNHPNLGHFIHDILSRIYYEKLGVIKPGREKIIAPRFPFPMQKILFEKIFKDYEIVHHPPRTSLNVEELLLPANLCSPTKFNTGAINYLINQLRSIAMEYGGTEPRKICVSRKDGKAGGTLGRNFINIEAYEDIMRKFGYQIVEISRLDPKAQLTLFSNTTDFVGIHGAGMMNTVFMPAGGNYTEITGAPVDPIPHMYCHSTVAHYAMIAGHNVSGLVGELDRNGHPKINIERLESILQRTS